MSVSVFYGNIKKTKSKGWIKIARKKYSEWRGVADFGRQTATVITPVIRAGKNTIPP